MKGWWGRAAAGIALAICLLLLVPAAEARDGASFADLDRQTQRRIVEAARAYFDPEVEFLWRPRLAFERSLDSLKALDIDALADVPFMRQVVYQGRGFLASLSDPRWQGEHAVTATRNGVYRNLASESLSLTYVEPRSYPRSGRGLDRIPRPGPHPLLVCLHDPVDAPADADEPVFPGEAVLKRRYPQDRFQAFYRTWLLLAPWAPEGRYLAEDGAIRHDLSTRPLTELTRRAHVDFERVVLDGRDAAAAIAAAHPFLYAGLVLRSGPIDPALVPNYAHVPVFVPDDEDLVEALVEAGHPDVTRGEGNDLATWLQERYRTTPTSIRWAMTHTDQEVAHWIHIREVDGGSRIRALRAEILDPEDDPNTIRIDGRGIGKIDVYLNDELVDLGEDIRLVVNGRVETVPAPGRAVGTMFDKGFAVRKTMAFWWLYPAVLPGVELQGDARPEREPPVSPAEVEAARLWEEAAAAGAEGEAAQARDLYGRIVALGETSYRERALERIARLDAAPAPGPEPAPADVPSAEPLPDPPPAGEDSEARAVEPEEEEEAEPVSMTASEFEQWLEGSRAAMFLLILLKYGMAFVGVVLLVIAYKRWDRIRTGRELQPPRPPLVESFDALQAVGFLIVFFVAGQLIIGAITAGRPDLGKDIVFRMAAASAILLPLAAIVILRRMRLLPAHEPTPSRSVRGGLWTFAVASAMVIPAGFLTFALLEALGHTPTVYGPVAEAIHSGEAHIVWWLTLFAVFVAPFTEESVFRGMLYPAVRKLAGGGRKGAWTSAILTSVLFAAVHYHETSFLPLFALAMVFSWTFEKTDRLAPVMIAHGLWNASSMIPVLVRFSS
ncbi:MAG: CPBP family glutamic-type intramembrane protease [Planctomycetota bacterium]|jgi:membrane protease YdiL (CAAX protease family)